MRKCVSRNRHCKKKEILDPQTTHCTMDILGTTSVYQVQQGRSYEQWGNVCPARARHATVLLTIPTSAPDLPSHG